MLGLVGRKRHEAELLRLQKEAEESHRFLSAENNALVQSYSSQSALLAAKSGELTETQTELQAAQTRAREIQEQLQKQNNELAQALFAKTKEFDAQAHALLEVHAASEAAQENARRAEQLRLEAEAKARLAEAEKEAADIRCRAVEAECARVCACHAGRVRIFVMPLDPLEMTARARAVVGDVRIAWSADEKALVGDSGHPLTEGEYNGVVAAMMPRPDRT